jgi:hypothetical protein
VGEKSLVAAAQVVQSCFTVRRPEEAVFRAFAVAHLSDLTRSAKPGQSLELGPAEGSLLRTLKKLDKRCLTDIPEAMVCVHEMVAGKEISVVFNDWDIAAGWPEEAKRMFLPESRPGRLFENLNFDPADVLVQPFIEDSAKKIAPGFSRHGVSAHSSQPIRMRLDKG